MGAEGRLEFRQQQWNADGWGSLLEGPTTVARHLWSTNDALEPPEKRGNRQDTGLFGHMG